MKISLMKISTILIISLFVISPIVSTNQKIKASSPSLNTTYYQFLIITPKEFLPLLQPLVNHKIDMGMTTKLVSLEDVYDQMFWHGRDESEQIKYFIKTAIETWQTEYVLLVGDFRKMPIRYVHNQDILQGFNEPVFISELYYADIYNADGSFSTWDTDNDGIFGEWYDDGITTRAEDQPIDLYPDVAVGRIACINNAEVNTMVDKIITYETTAYNADWSNNLLVCAGDTYPDMPTNEGEENTMHVLENMTEYDQQHLWTSDGTLTGVKDIIKAFNQGLGFVYFDGHANPFRWSTHPPGDHETWIKAVSYTHLTLPTN